MEEETEYELWQGGVPVAFANSLKEIMHYAAMYSQDGPVRVVEVKLDTVAADE